MNQFYKNFTFLTALGFAVLVANQASALPDDNNMNLREACRQAVAGEYMSAFDNAKATKSYLGEIERMIQRLSSTLSSDRKELIVMRQKIESVTYDVKLSDSVIHQTEKVKALESTLDLYRDQLETARAKLSSVTQREQYLKKNIQPVFTIIYGSGQKKDYPSSIAYKAECPRFRHMCPLPLPYHELLAKIMLKEESESICSRYISYSKMGRR